jgi:hypothetical protein
LFFYPIVRRLLKVLNYFAYALINREGDGLARCHTEHTGRDAFVKGTHTLLSVHGARDGLDPIEGRDARFYGRFLET